MAGILATSRAMGDFPLKDKNFLIATPDILTFDLNEMKPKFVILASDGLWDVMSNEAAVEFVLKQFKSMRNTFIWSNKGELGFELARRLALEAYQNGSLDNISVIVWLFDYESQLEKAFRPLPTEHLKVKTPKIFRESDLSIEPKSQVIPTLPQSTLTNPATLCNARPLSAPASSAAVTSESPSLRSIRDLSYSCAWQSDKSVLRLVDTGPITNG